jgi:predicted O-linked N-acetylglucosamine transferase (SPINDLY family)
MTNTTTDRLLGSALQFHQSGKLAEAEQYYRKILANDPNHTDSLHNLGIIAYQLGRHEIAITLIGKAIALNDRIPHFHNSIGIALYALGQLEQAVVHYEKALVLNPGYAEAHNNLGSVLKRQRKLHEAVQHYQRALTIEPTYAEAHNNLGNALKDLGKLDAAVEHYQHAVTLKSGYAEGYYNLANALQDQGKLDMALAHYERALALKPDFAAAHNNLGIALQKRGQLEAAVAHYQRALVLKPDYVEAHNNLGTALTDQGKFAEAVAQHERALALKPDHADAHHNLGYAFQYQGQLDAAVAQYQRALALKPDHVMAHSGLLFSLNSTSDLSPKEIFAEHRRWDECHARPQRPPVPGHDNNADPNRRLRIGYVSPDLYQHSVAWFFEPLLTAHDRESVEIFCYAEVKRPDDVTDRFKALADHWRVTVGLSDEAVAAQIVEDGIDILVDLAGHTAGNRLLVFARRPAPVQVTWLGYPNTTGLSAIDYRLVDAVTDPKDNVGQLASEKLVRLEGSFLCYGPPNDAPPMTSPPSLKNGIITFGSFNNPTKYSAATVHTWAQLLSRVQEARLVLKGLPFSDESTRDLYHARFSACGIAAERVILLGRSADRTAHLSQYREIDIALDPFPYNGTTTTCEALWMGVPVVTLRGDRHSARVGASVLGSLGLDELIARDAEHYVAIAVRLANDRSRLMHLRGSLRAQMQASSLCDAPRFARKMEAAYRSMWQCWCEENLARLQT